MNEEASPKARAFAGAGAVTAVLCFLFAFAKGFGAFSFTLSLVGAIILALLLEAYSATLVHYGYISLAFPVYCYAVVQAGELSAGQALAQGLLVALVPLVSRLVHPANVSLWSRLTYVGINAGRILLVGGTLALAYGIFSGMAGQGLVAMTLAALVAGGVYLAFDQVVVTAVVSEVEAPADLETWHNVLARSRFLLPSLILVGILGAAFSLEGGDSEWNRLAGLMLACVMVLAVKGALRSAVEELVVKDQEQLELQIKSFQHQNRALTENNKTMDEDLKALKNELDNLYELARALGASTLLEDTMGIVQSMIRRLRIPYQSCVIFLERDGNLFPALSDTPYKDVLDMSHLLQLEETLIKQVIEQRRPKLVPEMSSSSEQRIFKDERSVMCVPLVVSKEIVGVIYVGSVRPATHKEEHLDTLRMLAAFAAPSIKTAMLFEDKEKDLSKERKIREAVEAKNQQLAGLQKMGQAIGSTLAMNNTMNVVANSLKHMIPEAQSVIIFTHEGQEDKHAVKAEFALTPYSDYVKNLQLRDDEGLLGKAIELNSTLLVQDTNVYDMQNLLAFERSVVVAPLMARGESDEHEVLGCLYVGASRENAFSEEHRNLVETVSYQTAMALKNARLYEQTQQMALTDGLTGLYTHRLFQVRLSDEIDWAERHHKPFCLVMVDTDNFKTYNDTLGHPMGDALLKEIAALLKDKVRNTDIVCRYGGDEFSLILRETGKDMALKTAERIREAFQLRFGGHEVPVTASIGLACFPLDATTKKDLAKAADDALYMSKRGGRNRVTASPPLEERLRMGEIQTEPLPR